MNQSQEKKKIEINEKNEQSISFYNLFSNKETDEEYKRRMKENPHQPVYIYKYINQLQVPDKIKPKHIDVNLV